MPASSTPRSTHAASALVLLLATSSASGCAAEEIETEEAEATASSIVGGQRTSAFPAVGALTKDGVPFCTGTVVAPRVVVTAAHCFLDLRPRNVVGFAVGANSFAPEAHLRVTSAAPHPRFNMYDMTNDIAFVVLEQDAPVAPIPLNSAMDDTWVGRPLTFVGYGATDGFARSVSGAKREVAIPVRQVGPSQFLYADPRKNTCFGDSGGPALATDDAGNTVLVGVTSYGDRYCRQFGVNTRTDVFRSFLASAATR